MICRFYDRNISIEYLRELTNVTQFGTSLLGLSTAAEKIGFRTISAKLSFEKFVANFSLPTIVHWDQKHFIVVYRIHKGYIYVADPSRGKVRYDYESFLKGWSIDATKQSIGYLLFIEATPVLYSEDAQIKSIGFSYFLTYFKGHRRQYIQIVFGMLASMLLTFIVPFTAQSVVDIGINGKNMSFVNMMLIAQVILAISGIMIGFIQSWVFMHLGTKVGLSITVGYITKVMKLTIPYVERKSVGDFLQRMSDNGRIQAFISTATLSTVFSFLNVIVFGIVMGTYSLKILAIFFTGSMIYALWIMIFIKKRKAYDTKRFEQNAESQTSIIQIFNGLRDIKLYNFEKQKRWDWEKIQAKNFRLSMKQLSLSQVQQSGAFIIEQTKNIIISYIVVSSVIKGEITFGTMVSIQYILGQMGSPLLQLINFINSYQDAKISLERIAEIHGQEDEESLESLSGKINDPQAIIEKSITFDAVTFSYNKILLTPIIKTIDLTIPEGKFTAIVGGSGCGKTTLLKILLRFYEIDSGNIKIGEHELSTLSISMWRDQCGAVLQDSYLFSDTILNNIVITGENVKMKNVINAAKLANIHDFIRSLPLGYKTKIGENGLSMSQGQKQRLLIARIAYKNPDFIFFDEATNALDSENEKIIMDNIINKLKGKTIIFVSHRLSAIKNADNIVVMDNGIIAEQGTHLELLKKEGVYAKLVNNQLTAI